VLVHDAARACLSRRDLDRLLQIGAGESAGALLAVPVSDTIKQADTSLLTERTLDRSVLWQASRRRCSASGPCRRLAGRARRGQDAHGRAQAMMAGRATQTGGGTGQQPKSPILKTC